MSFFVDVSTFSLNKENEELCGDKVEYFRKDDSFIAVLSDGLGSGVKANILSTLTSKIAITMLKEGAEISEVVDTIAHTLPVCKVRKLAYSTFSIVKILKDGTAYIAEFDNPKVFFLREGRILNLPYNIITVNNRDIKEVTIKLEEKDTLVLCSDGVVHAGAGKTLNLGWQWENVANYLQELNRDIKSSKDITSRLIGVCEDLYMENPGDDTTVLTLQVKNPEVVALFSGPPVNKANDVEVVTQFMKNSGKKIVCGGTAANILSRELHREIKTTFEMIDPKVPPTAEIKGVDLVTEGVLTIKAAVEKLKRAKNSRDLSFLDEKDGASRLAKMLCENCTHLKMLIGRAVNPAHQNPDFPQELSIKLNLLNELKEAVEQLDKVVTIEYY